MILGDGVEDKGKKNRKGKYGTMYERMTSPGREYMREYISTPGKKEKKKSVIDIKKVDMNSGASYGPDQFALDKAHDKNEESKGSSLVDESFHVRNTFYRPRKQQATSAQHLSIDKCSIY